MADDMLSCGCDEAKTPLEALDWRTKKRYPLTTEERRRLSALHDCSYVQSRDRKAIDRVQATVRAQLSTEGMSSEDPRFADEVSRRSLARMDDLIHGAEKAEQARRLAREVHEVNQARRARERALAAK